MGAPCICLGKDTSAVQACTHNTPSKKQHQDPTQVRHNASFHIDLATYNFPRWTSGPPPTYPYTKRCAPHCDVLSHHPTAG